MRSKPESLKRKLAWKAALILAAALIVLLIILAVAPRENLWFDTKRALEARGELLDWQRFIPAEVADADNLFADPVAASLLPLKGLPTRDNPLGVGLPTLPSDVEPLGVPFELSKLKNLSGQDLASEVTLEDLDQWFAQWDETFARFRQAAARPAARLPGDYIVPLDAPIPNFVAIRSLAQVIVSRARVHIAMDDSAAAFQDLQTLAVVRQALDTRPASLVLAMIHVAVTGLYLDLVEDGLNENLWHEEQLQELIPTLRRIHLVAALKDALQSERAALLMHFESLANGRRDKLFLNTVDAFATDDSWSMERAYTRFAPASWIRKNQVHYALAMQNYIDCIDSARQRIDLAKLQSIQAQLSTNYSKWSPHHFLANLATPSFSRAGANVGRNQTHAHEIAFRCAIEIFKIRHGRWPDQSSDLIPAYIDSLPHDVLTGDPYHYSRTAEGYSLSAHPITTSPP